MKYELTIFDQIMHGSLSPIHSHISRDDHFNFLFENKNKLYELLFVTLIKSKSGTYSVVKTRTMNGLNPHAEDFMDMQMFLFNEVDSSHYGNILEELGVSAETILKTWFYEQQDLSILLVKKTILIDNVDTQELKFYHYALLLKQEYQRLIYYIRDNVFKIKAHEKVINFIQKFQQALNSISDEMIAVIKPKSKADLYVEENNFSNQEILRITYICIEELQKFLEKNYFVYLDLKAPVPHRSTVLQLYELASKAEALRDKLIGSEVNEALIQILDRPLKNVTAELPDSGVSYNELIYLNKLLTAFEDRSTDKTAIEDVELINLLFSVNFNDRDFLNYEIDIHRRQLNALENGSDKISYLSSELKVVSQRTTNLSMIYDPQLASLKDQLSYWIEQELNYLERGIRKNEPNTNSAIAKKEIAKMQSGMSVAELSLFFKLQVNAGIIKNKTQREIFRHIMENYQTLKASTISEDSIANRYYNIEGAAIESVKHKVIDMLNYIKEYSHLN